MLLVAERGREAELAAVFEKWDLHAVVIGTNHRRPAMARAMARQGGRRYSGRRADRRRAAFTIVPRAPPSKPAPAASAASVSARHRAAPAPAEALRAPARQPQRRAPSDGSIGSTIRWCRATRWRGRAATPRCCESRTRVARLALKVDSNPRACALDPYLGAVGDGRARRRATSRARARGRSGSPTASTTAIPSGPEIMWQFIRGVEGLRDAALAFETPVVSGNVSFYNETEGRAIPPTPTIAMLGVLDDVARHVTQFFKRPGDAIAAGADGARRRWRRASMRRYLRSSGGSLAALDLERERALVEGLVAAADRGLIRSAHDVAEGGLAVALAESLLQSRRRSWARRSTGMPQWRWRRSAFWRRRFDRSIVGRGR